MSSPQKEILDLVVREKTIEYMTFPGSEDFGTNSCHRRFRRIIEGQVFDYECMDYYDRILDYRLSMLERENGVKNILGLESPHPRTYDTWCWIEAKSLQARSQDSETSANAE